MIVSLLAASVACALIFGVILDSYHNLSTQETFEAYYTGITEATEHLRRDARVAHGVSLTNATDGTGSQGATATFTMTSLENAGASSPYQIQYRQLPDTCWINGKSYPCIKLERRDSRSSASTVTFSQILQVSWCLWSAAANPQTPCPPGVSLPSNEFQPEADRAFLFSFQLLPLSGVPSSASKLIVAAEMENSLSTLKDSGIQRLRTIRGTP
jgi:hypothetical protein